MAEEGERLFQAGSGQFLRLVVVCIGVARVTKGSNSDRARVYSL